MRRAPACAERDLGALRRRSNNDAIRRPETAWGVVPPGLYGGNVRLTVLFLLIFALVPSSSRGERSLLDRVLDPFDLFGEKAPKPGPNDVVYAVEIPSAGAGDELDAAIRAASNLGALKNVPPSSAAGLLRRAAEDRARITAALYAQGYYGGRIAITAAGVPADSREAYAAVETARHKGPVPVRVAVTPGPLFRFGRVGFVDAQGGAPVPAPLAPEALGLVPGQPARSTAILAAEGRLAAAMRKEGRPFAEVAGRDVVADHAAGTVDVTFHLKRGPVAAFGEVTVEGTERLDPGFVRRRSGFTPGERYDPERLAAYRKELTRHDVFDFVRIAEGDRLDDAGRVPIRVQVKERLRRFVGFGAKYSNTDRIEINGYWGHRNLFGGAERLRLEASATALSTNFERVTDPENLGFRLAAAFAKPGILTVRDDLLLDVSGFREVTDAYRRTGVQFNAGIRRRFDERLSLLIGIDLEFTDVRDAFGDADYRLVGFPITLAYDSTDNALDPTRGWRITALLEPFPGFGGSTTEMLVAKATASTYVALDEKRRWVVAGRIAAGSLIGPSIEDVPAHRRFYVGGGGSLRGFAFQSVSPRDFAGRIIGGKSFLEGSLELRTRITDTIGAVAFVDAGAAYATSFPNFDETMRIGAGVGLRYFTAIGPLRADIAFPLNRRKGGAQFGLYLSLGQAF